MTRYLHQKLRESNMHHHHLPRI